MNPIDLEKLFSHKRLYTYYRMFPTDTNKAIEYYCLNTQVSESLYPLLCNLETAHKRRDKIAFKLNQVRKFRNRIFHYEPICNDLTALAVNHTCILEVLNWINADVVAWTKQIDRFDHLYKQAVSLRLSHIE